MGEGRKTRGTYEEAVDSLAEVDVGDSVVLGLVAVLDDVGQLGPGSVGKLLGDEAAVKAEALDVERLHSRKGHKKKASKRRESKEKRDTQRKEISK